jgi:DDE_Tnp_1-associated
MGDFFVIFEALPDPRDINARHDLREILFIALAAMLCGAESCVEGGCPSYNHRTQARHSQS